MRVRRTLLTALGCLTACDTTAPEAGPAVLVIQLLLRADRSEQEGLVEWSYSADSTFEYGQPGKPVAAGQIDLALIRSDAEPIPVVPDPQSPGKIRATLQVTPGNTYVLQGTVAGIAIQASVVVPAPLEIMAPAGDTVFAVKGPFRASVPYAWHADGAEAYYVLASQSGPFTTAETEGVLSLFIGSTDTITVDVLALDPNAARFLHRRKGQYPGNLSGIGGYLGAATSARRVVILQ